MDRVNGINLIGFDCDSTLSGIEGIDELARLRGPECYARIDAMTRDAMEGRIALDEIFARRLEIVKPTRAETEAIGRLYIERIEPDARAIVATLRAQGWTPLIISGGFTQAIAPLAAYLEIGRIEAVALIFDGAGNYAGYDPDHPASRRGGKPQIVRALRSEFGATRVVMVGDGVSDLETQGVADLFVGFGRYVARPAVRAGADKFIERLAELPGLLGQG